MDDSLDSDRRGETPREHRNREQDDVEEMGALGQPVSEPAPRGTFILLLLFLILLVAAWLIAYLQIWDRGAV